MRPCNAFGRVAFCRQVLLPLLLLTTLTMMRCSGHRTLITACYADVTPASCGWPQGGICRWKMVSGSLLRQDTRGDRDPLIGTITSASRYRRRSTWRQQRRPTPGLTSSSRRSAAAAAADSIINYANNLSPRSHGASTAAMFHSASFYSTRLY